MGWPAKSSQSILSELDLAAQAHGWSDLIAFSLGRPNQDKWLAVMFFKKNIISYFKILISLG